MKWADATPPPLSISTQSCKQALGGPPALANARLPSHCDDIEQVMSIEQVVRCITWKEERVGEASIHAVQKILDFFPSPSSASKLGA